VYIQYTCGINNIFAVYTRDYVNIKYYIYIYMHTGIIRIPIYINRDRLDGTRTLLFRSWSSTYTHKDTFHGFLEFILLYYIPTHWNAVAVEDNLYLLNGLRRRSCVLRTTWSLVSTYIVLYRGGPASYSSIYYYY